MAKKLGHPYCSLILFVTSIVFFKQFNFNGIALLVHLVTRYG